MDFNIEGPPTLSVLHYHNMVNDGQGIFGAEWGSFSVRCSEARLLQSSRTSITPSKMPHVASVLVCTETSGRLSSPITRMPACRTILKASWINRSDQRVRSTLVRSSAAIAAVTPRRRTLR